MLLRLDLVEVFFFGGVPEEGDVNDLVRSWMPLHFLLGLFFELLLELELLLLDELDPESFELLQASFPLGNVHFALRTEQGLLHFWNHALQHRR
jgi:hypothetical protein